MTFLVPPASSSSTFAPLFRGPKRAWKTLIRETSTTEPGTTFALFRMATALALLALLLPLVTSPTGERVLRFAFTETTGNGSSGGYRDLVTTPLMELLGGASEPVQRALVWVSVGCAGLMLVGLFGRTPVVCAAVSTRVLLGQNHDVSGAGDALLANALFLLALGRCTQTLSLDAWWRTGRFVDPTPIPAWPRRLAVLQLAVMYTSTGLQKLVSTAWTPVDGCSALFQILQSPHWARFPGLVAQMGRWLVAPLALLTAVTTLWECTFFVVLWKRRWRWLYAATGVFVHLGIAVLMEVGVFSWLSMAFYPLLFSSHARLSPPTTSSVLPDSAPTFANEVKA
jgi:hypothetical protein